MKIHRVAGAMAIAVATAGFGVRLSSQAPAASRTECSIEALQSKAPKGTTLTRAALVEAAGTQPRHCLVDGHTATPGNEVNFRLGLPEQWNGKFYFVGVGGLGGTIGRLDAGLARGYASASTDTGHVAEDTTWGSNRAKEIDYGHRGTHVTAVSSKELTGAFYGRAPEHSYFNGCSNGGRQALMEVQRYPNDFDGIIGGDPATGTPMQVGRALVFQKLLASPQSYVPAEKIEMLSSATLAACDEADGLEDGLVSDPRACSFEVESLKCSAGDAPDCFTAPQLDVVRQIYSGVKLPNGDTYAYGFPLGHEGGTTGWRAWTTGPVPPTPQEDGSLRFTGRAPSGFSLSEQNFRFLALDQDDPAFSWRTFKLGRDLPRMKTMTEILTALDPDLRAFKNRGGKLILYHGLADPAISAYGTIDYFEQVQKAVGGAAAVESFARLYLGPGMHHCSGGPGPNEFEMITELENWVERGRAPAAVVAAHKTDAKIDRTRPLCPYPQQARYKGTGSIDEAASFTCEAPR